MTTKQISEAFSIGKFDIVYPFMSDKITWEIIGESKINGKKNVIKHCNANVEYFKTIETDFRIENVISESNKIAVFGTAEFYKDNKSYAYVYACDVYEFDRKNQLTSISSYCIPKKN